MRAKSILVSHRFLIISCVISFSLLWSTAHARQEPGEAKDEQIAVSRKTLRTIAFELSLICDSIREDISRLEKEYRALRQDGARTGDSKEKSIRSDLERQRKSFNLLVDQMKQLQLLADGK